MCWLFLVFHVGFATLLLTQLPFLASMFMLFRINLSQRSSTQESFFTRLNTSRKLKKMCLICWVRKSKEGVSFFSCTAWVLSLLPASWTRQGEQPFFVLYTFSLPLDFVRPFSHTNRSTLIFYLSSSSSLLCGSSEFSDFREQKKLWLAIGTSTFFCILFSSLPSTLSSV